MIELDGQQVVTKTVEENTTELVNYINNYCSNNNITNNEGEIINIETNIASPLYLLCRGLGYQLNVIQNMLLSAAQSISIGSSTDTQLLNLAAIAGIQRKRATKTTMAVIVYASDDTDCEITTSLTLTVTTGSGTCVFNPAYDITIEKATSQYLILVANDYGSHNISANTVSIFDDNPTGFSQMVNFASVPGTEQESISSLRRRILLRADNKTWISKVEEAISSLEGISWCSVYYNSASDDVTIYNNIVVKSRHVLITIQGYSDHIAETYLQYCCAPTTSASSERCLSQDYTLQIGQKIIVYFFIPRYVSPYINVYLNKTLSDEEITSLKQTIALLSQNISVGQGLTSSDVLNIIQNNTDYLPNGVTLSLDGDTYSYQIEVDTDQLLVFDSTYINIEST